MSLSHSIDDAAHPRIQALYGGMGFFAVHTVLVPHSVAVHQMYSQHIRGTVRSIQPFAQQGGVVVQVRLTDALAGSAVERFHVQNPFRRAVPKHFQRRVFPRQGQHLRKIAVHIPVHSADGPEDGSHVQLFFLRRLIKRFHLNVAHRPEPFPHFRRSVRLEGLVVADTVGAGVTAGDQRGMHGVGQGGVHRFHVVAEHPVFR